MKMYVFEQIVLCSTKVRKFFESATNVFFLFLFILYEQKIINSVLYYVQIYCYTCFLQTSSNVELFSIFLQTFLELIFAMLFEQSAVLCSSCQKNIAYVSEQEVAMVQQVVCWLIRRKARVRVPGQTSKRNTKSISSAISSQQISGKNTESK